MVAIDTMDEATVERVIEGITRQVVILVQEGSMRPDGNGRDHSAGNYAEAIQVYEQLRVHELSVYRPIMKSGTTEPSFSFLPAGETSRPGAQAPAANDIPKGVLRVE